MKIDKKLAGRIIAEIKSRKIDFSKKDYSFFDLVAGAKVETEHNDTVGGSVAKFIDIAIDHLDEFGNYYKGLKKMEKNLEKKAINLSSIVSGLGSVAGAAKPYLRQYGNLMSTDIGKLKNQRSVYNKAMEWATNPIAKGRSARRATQIAEGINMPEVESTIRNARIAQYGTLGAGLLGGGYVANKLDNMSQPRQQEFNIPGYGPYEYGMEGQAVNRYYEQGFIDKCAEYDISKEALDGRLLRNVLRSGDSAAPKLLTNFLRNRFPGRAFGHPIASGKDRAETITDAVQNYARSSSKPERRGLLGSIANKLKELETSKLKPHLPGTNAERVFNKFRFLNEIGL